MRVVRGVRSRQALLSRSMVVQSTRRAILLPVAPKAEQRCAAKTDSQGATVSKLTRSEVEELLDVPEYAHEVGGRKLARALLAAWDALEECERSATDEDCYADIVRQARAALPAPEPKP